MNGSNDYFQDNIIKLHKLFWFFQNPPLNYTKISRKLFSAVKIDLVGGQQRRMEAEKGDEFGAVTKMASCDM